MYANHNDHLLLNLCGLLPPVARKITTRAKSLQQESIVIDCINEERFFSYEVQLNFDSFSFCELFWRLKDLAKRIFRGCRILNRFTLRE